MTQVVVFAKSPIPGTVKTRLAATIGYEAAARAHQAFIADTVAMIGSLDVRGVLAWAGDKDHVGFDCARQAGFDFVAQPEGDLGQRMFSLLQDRLEMGGPILFVGTDSPTLPSQWIADAVASLESSDVVVGPSFDGGYVLIGLNAPHHEPFREITWSTPRVFAETLARCRDSGLECAVLPFWYDVDDLNDLTFLRFHLDGLLCHTSGSSYSNTLELIRSLEAEGIF
ncbi:MAG: TIGR04282 family arsenosugar biosynthesis glycosyltransferase [bacterium]